MISVELMYKRTLDKIRKSHIGTVTPDTWNRLISDALKEFKKSLWNDYETNRASIDLIYPLKKWENDLKTGEDAEVNTITIPSDWWKPCLGEVKVSNNNNTTLYPDLTPSIWIPSHELKSGERASVLRNPFTATNQKRTYFELRGTRIAFFVKPSLVVQSANMEYYHVPREIWYDKINTEDNAAYPEITDGYSPYELGYGSVNTEMINDVRTLLIEIASNLYLSEVGVHSPQRQAQSKQ